MNPTPTALGRTLRLPRFTAHALAALAALSACAMLATAARGGNVTWNLNANGVWDATTANWTGDSTTYTEGDAVTFGSVISANRTVTVQAGGVTPGSMTVNNAGSIYTFTGGSVLGGAFALTTGVNALFNQNADQAFASASVENGGVLRWEVAAPDIESVQPAYSFSTGAITMGSATTQGHFTFRGNQATAFKLTTPILVNNGTSSGPGTGFGGILTTGNAGTAPTLLELSGSVTLDGNLQIVQSSLPLTLSGPITVSGGARRMNFTQSHTAPEFAQTILSGAITGSDTLQINQNGAWQFRTLWLTGDNSGLTGAIETSNRGIVIFGSLASMGAESGKVLGINNTYVGFGFPDAGGSSSSGALARMATASQSNFGLDADSSADVDLTGFHSNVRLGTATRATYSGTFTPQGTIYRLGGGGGHLTVASMLSGTRTLSQGNVANVPASITTLTAGNTYTGTTLVESGILAAKGATARLGQGTGAHVTVNTAGALSLSHAGQVDPAANLTINGMLILDGIGIGDLLAGRTGTTTFGAASGFAARSVDQFIGTGDYDRDFTLGYAFRDWDGALYANAAAVLDVDIVLSADRTITVAQTGPGISGPIAGRVSQRIQSDISGAYVPFFNGGGGDDLMSEVVLAGANTWSGTSGAVFNGNQAFSAGPGGYLNAPNGATGYGGADVFLRFDGQAALPTGNGGNTAYLAALKGLSGGQSNRRGILLTSKPAGETYTLPAGYRFVLCGIGNRSHNAVFGATSNDGIPGSATLRNSDVVYHWGHGFTGGPAGSIDGLQESRPLSLLVRDGVFVLGTTGGAPDGPVRFVPAMSEDLTVTATATVLLDDDRNNHYLSKRGEGTLILRNVAYTLVDGTGDTAARFIWNIGRATGGNSGTGAYFDGAVRGLSTYADDATATLANSLFAETGSFTLRLRGGVYEVDANGASERTFSAAVGSGSGQVQWGTGGGGFAAYGGTLHVDLSGASHEWQVNNFIGDGHPLIFGSHTATHDVLWVDPLGLANGDNHTRLREIRVVAKAVEFEAGIRNRGNGTAGGTGTRSLVKTGAGTLRFVTGATYDYNGTTSVEGGTLEVNQDWNAAGSTVTVSATGKLGGTGTVTRDVVLTGGGAVAPGASVGTLTLGNVTVAAGGAYEWEFLSDGSSQSDKAVVTGDLTFTGPWSVRLAQLGAAVPGKSRYVLFDVAGEITGFDPEQATVELGETEWAIEYAVERFGDQIVLKRATEPATLILVR